MGRMRISKEKLESDTIRTSTGVAQVGPEMV
jgi:hypothetical protein